MYNLLKKENKMYEELANIIKEYSNKKRLLDANAFERIAHQIMNRKPKMRKFLREIRIDHQKTRKIADYNFAKNAITIYTKTCSRIVSQLFSKDDYIKKNEWLMSVFLHELNHTKQEMICDGPRKDLESNIIRISLALSTQQKFYNTSYKRNPLERLAEIDAYLQMYLIGLRINYEESSYYFEKTENELYRGYSHFTLNPTEKFFKSSNLDYYTQSILYKLLSSTEEIPLENKLRLGLAIKRDELHKPLDRSLTLKRLRK